MHVYVYLGTKLVAKINNVSGVENRCSERLCHCNRFRPGYIDNWNLILSNLKSQMTQQGEKKATQTGKRLTGVFLISLITFDLTSDGQ